MDKMLRDRKTILFLLTPSLLLYTLLQIFPIGSAVYYSFFEWDIISTQKFIGLGNYIRMFTEDELFWLCVKNMLFLTIVGLVLQQMTGFILAVILTGKIAAKNVFRNVFFMPAVISSAAVGLMWSFIYQPEIGLLNQIISFLGFEDLTHAWLVEKETVMWAIAFVASWQFIGYSMVLFIAAILNISQDVFEAAELDGAVSWKLVRYIIFPLVKPIFKVNSILIVIGSLKFFDLIYVMTGGGPANASQVLASYIYTRSFTQFEYGYGNALSVILLIMCLLFTFISNKLSKDTNE